MQYYCIVLFVLGFDAPLNRFMINVVNITLANRKVFMQRHANDPKVASTWYKRANGIPSPFGNDIDSPWFIPLLIRVLFWSLGFNVTIYL